MKKNEKIYRGWKTPGLKKLLIMMKLTVSLLLVSVMSLLAGNSYSQTKLLNLNMKSSSVKEVLQSIEAQSEFVFMYSEKLVDVNRKVSIDIRDKKIGEVLDELFVGTTVDYKVKDRFILLTTPEVTINDLLTQQQKSVSGKITDSSGAPLPGVTVLVKGTTRGSVTDIDGKYILTDIPEQAVLVFSFVGMKSQEIEVKTQNLINVVMFIDAIGIDEVVAIGYGTMKKKDFTGSLQIVKLNEISAVPNSTFLESMQGMVPGLNVTMSNSRPGATPDILIRGERSLSASNNPLLILDGVPFVGSLNEISPSDIESISVLKDVSSSAIYGARAANGVILITSKKGSIGKVRLSYNGSFGIETVEHMIDMHNGTQHMKKLEDVAKYIGWTYSTPEDLLFQNEKPQYKAGQELDWLDLIFRTGFKQDHTISMSGGNEKTTYFTSLGLLDEKGILEHSSFKRYTLRSNITHIITDWLKYSNNLQLASNDMGGFTPSIGYAIKMSPYGKLKEDNGTYTLYPQYPEVYNPSPFADITAKKDETSTNIFIKQNLVVTPTFIPGLSYDLGMGLTLVNNDYGSYYQSTTVTGLTPKGVAQINNSKNKDLLIEHLLTYKKVFGRHNLDITGLYSREKFRDIGSYIYASGFVNDIVDYHYVQAAYQSQLPQSWLNEKAIESMMGRINYNFNSVYYLTLTFRRDGYSGFGENRKYANFPSAALGYIISNAGFFNKNSKLLNYLKLRVSYGNAGNMAINPYQTLNQYGSVKYIYGDVASGTPGFTISGVGNPDLGWETTTSLNLGLDFTILNARLSGAIDIYNSKSSDLLMNRQVPIMNGYQTIWYNIGKTSGKGIEISLNSVNIDKKEFKWTTNFSFYLQRDKIVQLRGDNVDDIANGWFIGKPLRVFYGLHSLGLFHDQAEVAKYNAADYGKPGLEIIEDFNKDGKISEADRHYLGRVNPSFTAGMLNNFHYKKFDLGLQLYMVTGWKKSNGLLSPGTYLSEKQTNYPDIDYWSLDNPNGKYLNPGADKVMAWGGDISVQDCSYLRIQNVNLSYTFDNVVGVKNPKLTFNVKNAYTFTKWIGFDPEASNSFGPFPSQRIYTLGLNINF